MKAYVIAAETVFDQGMFDEYRKEYQQRSPHSAVSSLCAAAI